MVDFWRVASMAFLAVKKRCAAVLVLLQFVWTSSLANSVLPAVATTERMQMRMHMALR